MLYLITILGLDAPFNMIQNYYVDRVVELNNQLDKVLKLGYQVGLIKKYLRMPHPMSPQHGVTVRVKEYVMRFLNVLRKNR